MFLIILYSGTFYSYEMLIRMTMNTNKHVIDIGFFSRSLEFFKIYNLDMILINMMEYFDNLYLQVNLEPRVLRSKPSS